MSALHLEVERQPESGPQNTVLFTKATLSEITSSLSSKLLNNKCYPEKFRKEFKTNLMVPLPSDR